MLLREGRLVRVVFGPAEKPVQLTLQLDTKGIRGSVCCRVRVCGGGWARGGASGVLFVFTPVVEIWLRPFVMSNLPLGLSI
jgi:hypothetical protein